MNSLKSILGCSAALSAMLLTSACTRSERDATRERARETKEAVTDRKAEPAFVRYIDEHTGNANLYFGDTLVFSEAGDGKITDYKQVPAERKTFELRAAGATSGDALAHNSEGLDEGKHYTVVSFNDSNGKASLRVVKDDESAPSAGKAKVRIIHASKEMEGLNLYAAGRKDEIADQSRFSTGSTWQEVDPVKGNLEMRSTDKKTGTVRIPNVHLEAGKLYTFVVGGGDDTNKRFHVTPIIDTPRS